MRILVTGVAGFIGMHVADRLAAQGHDLVTLDSINDYYDIQLKHDRLVTLGVPIKNISYGQMITSSNRPNLRFMQAKLEDGPLVENLFTHEKFDAICNLAGQAGVRYSLEAPLSYVASNVEGFTVLLEASVRHQVGHLVYASTSSVYGLNQNMPYSPHHGTAHPVSLYAATKKANELFAHAYSHLHGLSTTGLRFFTVYGPWGRPDMAPYLFTKAILTSEPIRMFNFGDMQRDFTYIDDVVDAVTAVLRQPAQARTDWDPQTPDPGSSSAPYVLYNVGRGSPVKLQDFIGIIEELCGRKAIVNPEVMQQGDVQATWSDGSDLVRDFHYQPKIDLKTGLSRYVAWFREYYKL